MTLLGSATSRTRLPSLADRVIITADGLAASRLGIGIVGEPSLVSDAHALGVNFFLISADMHWPLYEGTRQGVRNLLRSGVRRDDIIVAGVSYVDKAGFCHSPFRELLDAVPELGHLDMTVIGGADNGSFVSRLFEYRKHSSDARIRSRAIGAGFGDIAALSLASEFHMVDFAMCSYRPEHREIRALCLEPRIGLPVTLFAQTPSAQMPSMKRYIELGLSDEKWRPGESDFIRYALSWDKIFGVLAYVASAEQLARIASGFDAPALTEEESEYMENLMDLDLGLAEMAQ